MYKHTHTLKQGSSWTLLCILHIICIGHGSITVEQFITRLKIKVKTWKNEER